MLDSITTMEQTARAKAVSFDSAKKKKMQKKKKKRGGRSRAADKNQKGAETLGVE